MDANPPVIDLTCRTEPLSLSDIARAFGLSRTAPQKWHKPPVQAATGGKAPAHRPALHAVAEAIGADLGPDVLDSPRPRYPVAVVLALGKALGYLDDRGHPTGGGHGKGRWFPAAPTTDPATGEKRHYLNHLAAMLGTTTVAIEMSLHRGVFTRPDGTDEMGRIFWWASTANKIVNMPATPTPDVIVSATRYTVSVLPAEDVNHKLFALQVELKPRGWIVHNGHEFFGPDGGLELSQSTAHHFADHEEALDLAKALAPGLVVNGHTATDAYHRAHSA